VEKAEKQCRTRREKQMAEIALFGNKSNMQLREIATCKISALFLHSSHNQYNRKVS
jgi:hypothetical protein